MRAPCFSPQEEEEGERHDGGGESEGSGEGAAFDDDDVSDREEMAATEGGPARVSRLPSRAEALALLEALEPSRFKDHVHAIRHRTGMISVRAFSCGGCLCLCGCMCACVCVSCVCMC